MQLQLIALCTRNLRSMHSDLIIALAPSHYALASETWQVRVMYHHRSSCLLGQAFAK